jgi:hypothetical protein
MYSNYYNNKIKNNQYYLLIKENNKEKIKELYTKFGIPLEELLSLALQTRNNKMTSFLLEEYSDIKLSYSHYSCCNEIRSLSKLLKYDKTEKFVNEYLILKLLRTDMKNLKTLILLIEDERCKFNNVENQIKLYEAFCQNGNVSLIKYLFSREDFVKENLGTGFIKACKYNKTTTARYLLEQDFVDHSINDNSIIKQYISSNNIPFCKMFFKQASFYKNLNLLKFTLSKRIEAEGDYFDYRIPNLSLLFFWSNHNLTKRESFLKDLITERKFEKALKETKIMISLEDF